MLKKVLLLICVVIFIQYLGRPTQAQDTFGPTCEQGITCIPTAPPTAPPLASSTPPPTRVPTLPVTGTTSVTYSLIGFGMLIFLSGTGIMLTFGMRRS
ncbi:hypothetical protein HY008_03715 [Candidatus Woesebacteria bacterium]|nr:hypothetical protein [Candidatus Woesebacteria bacterium]